MDEELAELTAELPTPTGPPVLPVSEMTPEVQLLTTLVQLTQNMLQQRSRKRINFPPLPMPRTARQLVRDRRRAERRDRTMRLVAEAQARWDQQQQQHDQTP